MSQAIVGMIAPVVKADGVDLPGEFLNAMVGLRISSGLRIPSRTVLEFLDDGFVVSLDNKFKLGTKIDVTTTDGEKMFSGEVTGVELDMVHGAPNLSVIADDPAYKMTLGNKVRTFTQVKYSDVVTKIAGEHGMPTDITPTSGTHEYLLQSDSDFGFLTEIADRAGYDWWVDAEGTLQFHKIGKNTTATASLSWMEGLRSLTVRASALHPGKVTVHGWDPALKQAVTFMGDTASATSAPKPTAELVDPFVKASLLSSQGQVQTAYRMYAKQADGKGFAASSVARWISGSATATGVCDVSPAIKVGFPVTVKNAGPASGDYPVTEVEHTYTADRGFETRFGAGDREPTGLVDTLSGASGVSSFRQDSLVVGVVTNLGNPSSPKGYVKVKIPALSDLIESSWARVVSSGAGPSRGMSFLPEVNDEVLIGFEAGDITRPLVLGGLYNGKDAALDYGTKDGKIAKRQIVSRLGHVVELGDGDAPVDQHIWLTLAGGKHAVKLGKDALTATVPAGLPVTISAGETKIEIDQQGNIALSGQKVTITAKQDVEISGLNIKLKAQVALEGSAVQAKLAGNAQAELSSGGQTSVKGSIVMIN